MDEYESLRHAKWECKYEVVSIPKHRGRCIMPGFHIPWAGIPKVDRRMPDRTGASDAGACPRVSEPKQPL